MSLVRSLLVLFSLVVIACGGVAVNVWVASSISYATSKPIGVLAALYLCVVYMFVLAGCKIFIESFFFKKE